MTRTLFLSFAVAALLSTGTALAAEDGAAIFATYCAMCHGPEGNGDGAAAAGLDPKPANLNKAEFWKTRDAAHIKKVVTEGGPSVGKSPLMAAWGAVLSAEQLDAVVKFVLSKKPAEKAAETPAETK
jgi:mono/diheme cytochrome c family protein